MGYDAVACRHALPPFLGYVLLAKARMPSLEVGEVVSLGLSPSIGSMGRTYVHVGLRVFGRCLRDAVV